VLFLGAFRPNCAVNSCPTRRSSDLIRKKVTSSEDSFQFLAAETTLLTMGLLNNITEHVTKSDSTGSGEYHSMRVTGTKKSNDRRSEEHTSELQSRFDLVCSLLLEDK